MLIHLRSIYTFDIILIKMPTGKEKPRNPELKNKDLKTNEGVLKGHRSWLEVDPLTKPRTILAPKRMMSIVVYTLMTK